MADSAELEAMRACATPEARRALLGELFQGHRARLRCMVELRIHPRIRGRLDPSDVLQESFIEALKSLETYLERPSLPLYLWLRFLTGVKLQDLHRKHLGVKARDAKRELPMHYGPGPEANSESFASFLVGREPSPSQVVAREETRSRILACLDEMEPLDREVLALRHFEELSSGEVATVLGIQEEAARKRYYRALGRLKSMVSSLGLGPKEGEGAFRVE